MKNFDRVVLLLLCIGIWALVFKPSSPTAHSGRYCDISGTGIGEVDDTDVRNGRLVDDSVTIISLSGEAYCY